MSPAATPELLAHEVVGTGEPVLLLNGGMMSYAAWKPVSARLAEERRVVLCDLRGQFLSPGDVPPDLDGHAAELVRLLDHLGLAAVDVVGTSFGAEVGIVLAAAAPERVRSLALVTAVDRTTPGMRRGVEELHELVAQILAGGDRGRFHDRLVEEVYSEAWRDAHRAELAARRGQMVLLPESWWRGLTAILRATADFDLRPRLAAVACPVLVVIAGDDRVMPPERSRELARRLGAEVVERPGAGHALVAEEPAWLAAVLLDFLA